MTYAQARWDFEFLERIALLDDQIELDSERLPLMENPTKKKAMELYEAGIRLWFDEHGVSELSQVIADRHGIRSTPKQK